MCHAKVGAIVVFLTKLVGRTSTLSGLSMATHPRFRSPPFEDLPHVPGHHLGGGRRRRSNGSDGGRWHGHLQSRWKWLVAYTDSPVAFSHRSPIGAHAAGFAQRSRQRLRAGWIKMTPRELRPHRCGTWIAILDGPPNMRRELAPWDPLAAWAARSASKLAATASHGQGPGRVRSPSMPSLDHQAEVTAGKATFARLSPSPDPAGSGHAPDCQ